MSSSGFGGGGTDYGATQEKGRVMEQVRSQIAVANLQEMIIVNERGRERERMWRLMSCFFL